ncbi:hypothetical protein [Microtetraspora niveoalba]|uniref:hypothetical protein n=1 Tax=Microtetraspora niveoalba TaxID=46175 RepID=UPI0008357E70|nr:hypothetical protein [Microtetraspora niveoalba]
MSPRLAAIAVSLISGAIIAVSVFAIVLVLDPRSAAPPATPPVARGDGGESDRPNLVMEEPPPPADASGAVEERTEAGLRQAAQTTLDLYSSGAYGQFWDAWTADARRLISRDDYLRLFELCRPIAENIPFEIKGVTLDGDIADVQVAHLFSAFTYQFAYEGGRWRYIPDEQAQAAYRSETVDQMAAARRAAKGCAE